MKSPNLWLSGSLPTDNSSGFTALPSGYRLSDASFFEKGIGCDWWSGTTYNSNSAWERSLNYNNSNVLRFTTDKQYAISIRCVKD